MAGASHGERSKPSAKRARGRAHPESFPA
jgi:hypothetical protein